MWYGAERCIVAAVACVAAWSTPAAAQSHVSIDAECQGVQNAAHGVVRTYTTITIRNWLTKPRKPLQIFGVAILDAAGTPVYSGSPTGLGGSLPPMGIFEFTTKSLAPGKQWGPVTIFLNGQYDLDANGQGNYWITSTRIDTDATGAIVSTDTTECLGGHN
jgi:hypothetical protein